MTRMDGIVTATRSYTRILGLELCFGLVGLGLAELELLLELRLSLVAILQTHFVGIRVTREGQSVDETATDTIMIESSLGTGAIDSGGERGVYIPSEVVKFWISGHLRTRPRDLHERIIVPGNQQHCFQLPKLRPP
ncbi:hypothetical protein BZA77DRAFT_290627 [Pyronema omphalodes]|nr:hypothetical protein BZA77DRAFT_290627 [Pyronema omphalodes]